MRRLDSGPRAQVYGNHVNPGPQLGFGGFVRSFPMGLAAMQAKIGDLEAFLATVTGALQQLSTQHIVHSPPPKPLKPDKFHGLCDVQKSQDGEVECHLVQPVGCCTTAAVSLTFLWHGWLGC